MEVPLLGAYLVDSWYQFSVALKIHVIASVNGVFVGFLAKLQSEQSVFAPGNVFLYVNFVLKRKQYEIFSKKNNFVIKDQKTG